MKNWQHIARMSLPMLLVLGLAAVGSPKPPPARLLTLRRPHR